MYYLVSALLKSRQKSSIYESVNIGDMTMKDLFANYFDGYITLTNPLISGNQYIDLKGLKSSGLPIPSFLTFNAWLGSIGNSVIPALPAQPVITTKKALYSDAFRALYNIQRAHPTFALDVEVPLADKTDVVFNKLGVDRDLIFNNVLVTINGLYHITDTYSTTHVRVKGGGKSCDVANQNTMGLTSFKEIGEVQSIKITDDMIMESDDDIPYKQTVWIKTDVDMTGKSVLLSLGGYLHVADSIYTVCNEELGVVQINMDKVALLHRYLESNKLIDLSSLELTVSEQDPEKVSLVELYSDDVIKRYLKLYQTFIVIVNTPSLYKRTERLFNLNLPGLYQHPTEPIQPVTLRSGIQPEYWPRREYDAWVINVGNNVVPNYHFETTRWQAEEIIRPRLAEDVPIQYSDADLVEIGAQVRA